MSERPKNSDRLYIPSHQTISRRLLSKYWLIILGLVFASISILLIFFPTFEDVFVPITPILPREIALGSKDALITVTEFAGPGCSECARFHRDVFPLLMQEYVSAGKIQYVFRVLATTTADFEGAALAECVREDNYLAFMDLLLRNQNRWAQFSDDDARQAGLLGYAETAGVDKEQAISCISSRARRKGLESVAAEMKTKFRVTQPPAYMIGGHVYSTGLSWVALKKAIDSQLSARGQRLSR